MAAKPLSAARLDCLSAAAFAAYLVTVAGVGTNSAYLALAVCALLLALPALNAQRHLRWCLGGLTLAVLAGSAINGTVAALRSVTPYMALLVAAALLSARTNAVRDTNTTSERGVWILYIAGTLQLAIYLGQAALSPYYSFLYSLDEFNRYGVGWLSIVCFFHTALPANVKPRRSHALRSLGAVFWLVPLLAALNSSRSELLMVAILASVALYFRHKLLFGSLIAVLLAASLAGPALTDDVSVIARASRSIDEVFKGDLETYSDVHANYRAFENLMMVERMLGGGPAGMALGCGLGCAVPFPFTMTLEDNEYDEIAVFHNGYLTALLHFGWIGLMLLLALARQLLRTWRRFGAAFRARAKDSAVQSNALRLATLLILLGTGLTTGGFMSSQDMLVLLLPLCSALQAGRRHMPILARKPSHATSTAQA